MARDKACPRCNNRVEAFISVRCRSLAVGGVKCPKCGKGKYLALFDIKGWYVDNPQMKIRKIKTLWND